MLDFVNPWHNLAYNFQTVHIFIDIRYYLESSGKKTLNRAILHLEWVCLLKVRYI